MRHIWLGMLCVGVLTVGAGAAIPPRAAETQPASAGLNAPAPEVLPDGSVIHGPFGFPNVTPAPVAPAAARRSAEAAVTPVAPSYPPADASYYPTYPGGVYDLGSSLVYPFNPYLRAGRGARAGRAHAAPVVNVVPTNGAAALPPIQPAYPLGVRAGSVMQEPVRGR